MPVERAPMIICTGYASVTAAKLSSLIFATYIESTVLYRACMSMATIEGMAMLISRSLTGSVPSSSAAGLLGINNFLSFSFITY